MNSDNMPRDDAATKIASKSTDRTVNPVEPYPKLNPLRLTKMRSNRLRKNRANRTKEEEKIDVIRTPQSYSIPAAVMTAAT